MNTLNNKKDFLINNFLKSNFKVSKFNINDKFIIYGYGFLGKNALAGFKSINKKPLYIVDDNKTGDIFIKLSQLSKIKNKKISIIITIWNDKVSFLHLKKKLKDKGFKNVFSYKEIASKYFKTFKKYSMFDNPKNLIKDKKKILEAFNLIDKDKDYLNFLKILKFYSNHRFNKIVFNKKKHVSSLKKLINFDTIVDCGAYDGDTYKEFVKSNIKFKKYIALEPDKINFNLLKKVSSSKKLTALNAKIGKKKTKAKFYFSGEQSTIKKGTKYDLVDVLVGDQIINRYKKNLIKMDIEGDELKALYSFKKTIYLNNSVFLISTYHQQDHFYKIINFFNGISTEFSYKLFLNTPDFVDTMLLAYPSKYNHAN